MSTPRPARTLISLLLQDTPGILARSVLDSAMVLDVIAGPDAKDSTCLPHGCAGDFASGLLRNSRDCALGGWLEGVTIGIPKEFNVEELGKRNVQFCACPSQLGVE